MKPLAGLGLVAVLAAGCGSAAQPHHHTAPAHRVSSSAPAGTYPQHAADSALCKTYNADINSGDTFAIQAALSQAGGSVSPKLAQAMQAVVNGTTVHQDLMAQVKVAMDCALVKVGRPPRS